MNSNSSSLWIWASMLNWKKTLEKTVALVDFSKVASCFSVGTGVGF